MFNATYLRTIFTGRDSIIGDATHPEGWEKIRLREAQWNRVPKQPTTPDAQEPPMFTKNLESHDKLMVSMSIIVILDTLIYLCVVIVRYS